MDGWIRTRLYIDPTNSFWCPKIMRKNHPDLCVHYYNRSQHPSSDFESDLSSTFHSTTSSLKHVLMQHASTPRAVRRTCTRYTRSRIKTSNASAVNESKGDTGQTSDLRHTHTHSQGGRHRQGRLAATSCCGAGADAGGRTVLKEAEGRTKRGVTTLGTNDDNATRRKNGKGLAGEAEWRWVVTAR
ncbi:hypothetical protein BC628DRAFT_355255 [Trametes gibbosa]|nr:hypothetical protein BC628DRAFT_355255 [Trametes gibbosa]